MVIDGFKSYAQRTEINGFDPLFNAITGLNGSGKSNILDAICFLLGISNLSQVSRLNWRRRSTLVQVYGNGIILCHAFIDISHFETWGKGGIYCCLFFTVRNVVTERLCFHMRLSFSSQMGGCLPRCMLGYTPGQTPPTAIAADGTHPTGMHSCS